MPPLCIELQQGSSVSQCVEIISIKWVVFFTLSKIEINDKKLNEFQYHFKNVLTLSDFKQEDNIGLL